MRAGGAEEGRAQRAARPCLGGAAGSQGLPQVATHLEGQDGMRGALAPEPLQGPHSAVLIALHALVCMQLSLLYS